MDYFDYLIADPINLKKILKDLASIRYENRINLNGYNEPTLNIDFIEHLKLIRSSLPYVHIQFNSNGDKINKNYLINLVNAGLNSLTVTFHPNPNKNLSIESLNKRIRIFLKKLDLPTDQTQKINFKKNYINFIFMGVQIKLQWPDWRISGSNRGGSINIISFKLKQRVKPCIRPYREFTIYSDGVITSCCEAYYEPGSNLNVMNNLVNENIFNTYVSEKMNLFRKSVFSFSKKEGVCKFCNYIDYTNINDLDKRDKILKLLDEKK